MQLNPYLSFKGDCEAAFRLYEQVLGGQIGTIFRYAGSPMAAEAPADWGDKVMHGTLTAAGLTLMGADMTPDKYEAPKGFALALHVSTADADRIFQAFADGGTVIVPLAQTFWAARFGMVFDRFGIPWSINGGEPDQPIGQ